jgi:hypothetical protein
VTDSLSNSHLLSTRSYELGHELRCSGKSFSDNVEHPHDLSPDAGRREADASVGAVNTTATPVAEVPDCSSAYEFDRTYCTIRSTRGLSLELRTRRRVDGETHGPEEHWAASNQAKTSFSVWVAAGCGLIHRTRHSSSRRG